MKINHPKKYYVGGLITLIFLPILFLVSTIAEREKAIHYGSLQINVRPDDAYGEYYAVPSIDSSYSFSGTDDETMLANFLQYCNTKKQITNTVFRIILPSGCNYGFFIGVIDILHENKFECGVDHRTIKFSYRPDLRYQPEYVPASTDEEIRYLKIKVLNLYYEYFTDEPLIPYHTYAPYALLPHPKYGPIGFSMNSVIKEEPKLSFYFQIIGAWVIPIILIWLLLLILSIVRSRNCCLTSGSS